MKAYFFGGCADGKVVDVDPVRQYCRWVVPQAPMCCAVPTMSTDITMEIHEYRRDTDYRKQLVYRYMGDSDESCESLID